MINKLYQLVSKGQFIETFRDIKFGNKVIVRPSHLAICKADQRYYLAQRPKAIMDKKLPMSLIHEGIGEVVYAPNGDFKQGDKVVMIPNTPLTNVETSSNYDSAKFRGSGFDGFTQEFVDMDSSLLLKINDVDQQAASMLELLSVCHHGVESLSKFNKKEPKILLIGDGVISYFTYLILKKLNPTAKVFVKGRHKQKLDMFKDATIVKDAKKFDSAFDVVYECVGGVNQIDVINEATHLLGPEGLLFIMGISEESINTPIRNIVEKGLTIVGRSRSKKIDFKKSIELLADNKFADDVKKIIGDTINIQNVSDMARAFAIDVKSWKKTVMEWNI